MQHNKAKAVVHVTPTPAPGHTTGEAVGWTIGSLLILSVPILFVGFWVAVIRFIWKRGTVRRERQGATNAN